MRVRHVGNSNVITLPKETEKLGYRDGVSVVVEELQNGQLLVTPGDMIRQRIRDVARAVVREDRRALRILEEHDRGKSSAPRRRAVRS